MYLSDTISRAPLGKPILLVENVHQIDASMNRDSLEQFRR